MAKFKDLTGAKFDRWTVIERTENKGKRIMWLCKCECGTESTVRGDHLNGGYSKSCGCLRTESHTKHGHSSATHISSEYSSWHNMVTRCTNNSHASFNDYAGRGITVCEKWKTFENFLEDMGNKPSDEYSIERIDNNKGYSPANCVWSDRITQQRNQRVRSDNALGIRGVYKESRSGKYIAIIYVDKKRMHLGSFDVLEDAAQAREKAELEYWKKSP
jgi:hypothetical protein